MTILNSFILGIVEGLTEFLPISSTAHLIFTSKILLLKQTEFQKFFEVFIQSGAIIAVLVIYWKKFFENKNNIKNICFSFIPTALIGLILHKMIKGFFENEILILSAFIFVGILFIVFEKYFVDKLNKSISEITIRDALLIGIGQSFAIVPGVSRAGAVIITMMFLKYKREQAALYSFLLAVPTIFAASGYDLLKTDFSVLNNIDNIIYLFIGFITAFLSALLVIKWFVNFLQKKNLISFGIYRIILGILLFLTIL